MVVGGRGWLAREVFRGYPLSIYVKGLRTQQVMCKFNNLMQFSSEPVINNKVFTSKISLNKKRDSALSYIVINLFRLK